jgi:hypothetical protein
VNPAPDRVEVLIVTAEFPVDDRVSVCVACALTPTFPKATLVVLKLKVGPAVSCRAKRCETPPALAVSVACCVELTGDTVALKPALVAPAATFTADGTLTSALLLPRFTVNPPLAAAAFSVTVQASVPAPAIELLAQLSAVSTGTPVPFRATVVVERVRELLTRANWPVACPATAGSNCTLRVAV